MVLKIFCIEKQEFAQASVHAADVEETSNDGPSRRNRSFEGEVECSSVRVSTGDDLDYAVTPIPEPGRTSGLTWIVCIVATVAAGFFPTAASAGATAPTFCKDVAPILYKHCANCHRPGESTFSLLSYDASRLRAEAIKNKVLMREMPPWPADPNESARFRNDPRLSSQEIKTLVAWVDGGARKGDDADLPHAPEFAQGWLHPKGLAPDSIISLPEVDLPATGEIPYVRHLAKVPFAEDKWIAAIQVRPSTPRVVHHMAITEVALDEGLTPRDIDALERLAHQAGMHHDLFQMRPAVTVRSNPAIYDMLGVYTPGATFEMYADDAARLLKAGKNLYANFNVHYQATGKPEKDRLTIALWLRPQPPRHQLFRTPAGVNTIIADGQELLTDAPGQKAEGTSGAIPPIPPYAGNYEVTGITAYTEPVIIYQLQPHAHQRGKDFKYIVVYNDGREETVLSVPKYDFHWQLAYDLETPLELPAGSKLVVTAHYDNSSNNKENPAPDKEVYFREGHNQSWDEMFTPFIQYAIRSQDPVEPAKREGLQPGQNEKSIAGQSEKPPERVLDIVEVGGCLEQSSTERWMVTHASDPVVSKTQATSSAAVKAAAAQPLGIRRFQLLGARFFNPSSRNGQKVVVKGVLIPERNEAGINVTSLQTASVSCAR
jgi:hypothetical protein